MRAACMSAFCRAKLLSTNDLFPGTMNKSTATPRPLSVLASLPSGNRDRAATVN
jgi:hypothetical protein